MRTIYALPTEEQKAKLRGAIKYFNGEQNNISVVIKIGRSFTTDSFTILCIVFFSIVIIDSYKIIELLTDVPNKIINAIILLIFIDNPQIFRAKKAPANAGIKAVINKSGIKNDSNCAPITQYKSRTTTINIKIPL